MAILFQSIQEVGAFLKKSRQRLKGALVVLVGIYDKTDRIVALPSWRKYLEVY